MTCGLVKLTAIGNSAPSLTWNAFTPAGFVVFHADWPEIHWPLGYAADVTICPIAQPRGFGQPAGLLLAQWQLAPQSSGKSAPTGPRRAPFFTFQFTVLGTLRRKSSKVSFAKPSNAPAFRYICTPLPVRYAHIQCVSYREAGRDGDQDARFRPGSGMRLVPGANRRDIVEEYESNAVPSDRTVSPPANDCDDTVLDVMI